MPYRTFVDDETWKRITYYERAARVASYVEANYSHPIPLAVAARVANMEPTSFSRFFRRKVGIGFPEFLRRYRMERATHAMRVSDRSLGQIAEAVGFGSMASFERAFKRALGASPSQFRRQALTPAAEVLDENRAAV